MHEHGHTLVVFFHAKLLLEAQAKDLDAVRTDHGQIRVAVLPADVATGWVGCWLGTVKSPGRWLVGVSCCVGYSMSCEYVVSTDMLGLDAGQMSAGLMVGLIVHGIVRAEAKSQKQR